ncbi:helix-turn-helix domain-containing protein [Frankia sp. Cr1]|uniref:AraC-like ligand-binding domain-containing protein n=1 Tax=Frankia sp. Cr1 TaxID=3073931 RepID=UPI002AD46CA5|nr:helix-turn-helix domain-containing protein [Frankia sp. Cr1]
METVIRTEDLPVGERFAFWLEAISRTIAPYQIHCDQTADFRATVRTVTLGEIQVGLLRHPSLEARRTPKLIRQSDPELYHLSVNLHGHVNITQGGQNVILRPGDVTLHDSSRPFRSLTTVAAGHHGAGILAGIPRALLPLPEHTVKSLLTVRMSGRDGIGALVTRYLGDLIRNAGQYSPADAARLATVTVDLVAALLAHTLDSPTVLPPEAHQRALFARIQAFIHQHLGDPALSPEMIAAAHHLSTRTLHRLFHTHDSTVAGWIRTRRLEYARRDLTDPRLYTRPIHAIAARWGFTSPAHFSRVFRATHGMAPQAYRAHHHDIPS